MVVAYKHEPFTDFTVDGNKKLYKEALAKVESEMGTTYPLWIGGEAILTEEKIVSVNPAAHSEVVGYSSKASKEQALEAITSASEAFKTWSKTTAQFRASFLLRVSHIIRRRKFEFSALLTKESGKPFAEADADTAEAIDFLEYYARNMLALDNGVEIKSRVGESNTFTYIPLGVGVIIPPWNFPFAILAGMTGAAVVTGNTVVLKPASATPVVAAKFMEVLIEAGLPAGVVNFVPGSGSEVGDVLVDDPRTRFISFTGSKEIGIRIYERAAKVHPGQKWLKRVIAEMGGKDTIVVDKCGDIELAAQSIVKSAFGFAGQKCSACSRAVIHEDIYEAVSQRVVELTEALVIGNPSKAKTYMGPVIDQSAWSKITEYIEIGKEEGTLLTGGSSDNAEGYFIAPTVFGNVAADARIMKEEIFGPVLALSSVSSFEEALEVANNTEFGLTGAVLSNNRAHLELAAKEFHVGNLYFNRGCTGAIVGYHPFGGFNMSGTDSKAGGPDYLQLHMQAKTISEMF
ncbi:MAG: L-glutamate gamma-semialdehyde dehydrogenase [Bacilli bacterium]